MITEIPNIVVNIICAKCENLVNGRWEQRISNQRAILSVDACANCDEETKANEVLRFERKYFRALREGLTDLLEKTEPYPLEKIEGNKEDA